MILYFPDAVAVSSVSLGEGKEKNLPPWPVLRSIILYAL